MTPLVVAVGGATGAILRWLTGLRVHSNPGELPLATLAVNLVGSLLLGLLLGLASVHDADPLLIAGLGTGVLGGFTTFSTFAVQVDALPRHTALQYLFLTVIGSIALSAAGWALGSGT